MFSRLIKSLFDRGSADALASPLAGDVIPLSEVEDETFAAGLLGEGVAVKPTGDRVVAPAAGKVEAIFPTGHAVALHSDDGFDVLIHVGLETYKLQGEHFNVHAAIGDRVEAGQVLIEFDRVAIEGAGYDITVPVLIRNAVEFASIKGNVGQHVAELEQLIAVKRR